MRENKGVNFILIIFIIMLFGTSCQSKKILYEPGTYEGTGQGHHGPIRVKVTTDVYRIQDIEIVEQQEIPQLSDIVYAQLPKEVIRANSTDVDVVAGASLTSYGLLEAIENALKKARIEDEVETKG